MMLLGLLVCLTPFYIPGDLEQQYIGLDETESGRDLSHKVVCIIRNHSGVGLKIFKVDYMYADDFNDFDASPYLDLDRWLLVVVKPSIEELTIVLHKNEKQYNFPCSLLSSGVQNSIWG